MVLELRFAGEYSVPGVVGWGYGENPEPVNHDSLTVHTINGVTMTASWDHSMGYWEVFEGEDPPPPIFHHHSPVEAAEEASQNDAIAAVDYAAWEAVNGGDADLTRRREVKDRMSDAFTSGAGTIDINVVQLLAKRLYTAFATISEKINENCAITGTDPLEPMESLEEELTALQVLADTDTDI